MFMAVERKQVSCEGAGDDWGYFLFKSQRRLSVKLLLAGCSRYHHCKCATWFRVVGIYKVEYMSVLPILCLMISSKYQVGLAESCSLLQLLNAR